MISGLGFCIIIIPQPAVYSIAWPFTTAAIGYVDEDLSRACAVLSAALMNVSGPCKALSSND